MKFKLEKSLRIITELIGFYNTKGAHDIKIEFNNTSKLSRYFFSAKTSPISPDEVTALLETLNLPRQHEIEEYYWNLEVDSDYDSELSLIGMMIDSALVDYKNNILTIELIRNELD